MLRVLFLCAPSASRAQVSPLTFMSAQGPFLRTMTLERVLTIPIEASFDKTLGLEK